MWDILGLTKPIYQLLCERYYWPQLQKDVTKSITLFYMSNCQRIKQITGHYTPLHIPKSIWEDLFMDFILKLPKTQRGYDSVLVLVDKFSKMSHFLPCREILDAIYITNLLLIFSSKKTVRLHGVPKSIVSDRNVKFLSYFWKTLWKKFNTTLKFCTTNHPQTNDQTKVTNRILASLIRCISEDKLKQWDLVLAQAAFAYNHEEYINREGHHLKLSTPNYLH